MSNHDEPWYKRFGAVLLAIGVALLGVLISVVGKGFFQSFLEGKDQKKRLDDLNDRLDDKSESARLREELVDAKKQVDIVEAHAEHEKKSDEIARKHKDAANNIAPDDMPNALLDSLNGAERKLR